jgi:hypothetical protein
MSATASQLLPYPFMRLTELNGAGQGNFAPWDPVLYTNNYDWRRNPIMLTELDGPMPLLGVAAGFGFSRSLRRRIKDRQAARRPGSPGP